MLHEGRAAADIDFSNQARTSWAQHQRVGPERRENHEYGFESGDCQDLSIPGRRAAPAANSVHEETNSADLATRVSEVACGSGWYHEAAIQESKPVREP